ncbi:MAG: UbiD family decarboxylase [Sulfolobales archaeon]
MYTLASFLKLLEDDGLLIKINSVLEPYLEPTRELMKSDVDGTTILFKVRDSDLLCVGNVVNTRGKLYRALGVLSDESAYTKLLNALNSKPELNYVDEFKDLFTYINYGLDKLPFIKFFENDGGMYVTSSIVIAKTPDVEGFNASVHRLMFIDRERVAIRIVPRHLYRIVSLNSRVGKDTPVAIVVGVHPALMLLASSSPPYGIFELGLAKELLGNSIRFCRTPKYDLPVPCDSALVMEGRITNEYVSEGPFLDLLNLYDRVRQQPIIHVESIYLNVSRDEQLFHVILPGGMEHKLLMGFPREASIWDVVRKVVPKVVKVRLTPAGGCWLHAVISIEKNSDGDAKNAILAAFAAHPSLKHVVVVDPDIDPDNPVDVEWAIATRFQAGEDLILIRGVRGSTLDPSSDDGITDKLGIDATAPLNKLELFRRVRT